MSYHGILCHYMSYVVTITASLLGDSKDQCKHCCMCNKIVHHQGVGRGVSRGFRKPLKFLDTLLKLET